MIMLLNIDIVYILLSGPHASNADRTFPGRCIMCLILHKTHRIHLGQEQTYNSQRPIDDQTGGQQNGPVHGVEGREIGGQEHQPQEHGGGDGHKDVPRLVEILGQLSGEEAKEHAGQEDDEVD